MKVVCCCMSQCAAACCRARSVLQRAAACCSVLQCVAVCVHVLAVAEGSVLQCVAVCCSVCPCFGGGWRQECLILILLNLGLSKQSCVVKFICVIKFFFKLKCVSYQPYKFAQISSEANAAEVSALWLLHPCCIYSYPLSEWILITNERILIMNEWFLSECSYWMIELSLCVI